MDALVQQLDSYSRLGIPKLQHCAVKFEAEDAVEEGKWPFLHLSLMHLFHSSFLSAHTRSEAYEILGNGTV